MENREIDKLVAEKVMGWELNDEGVAWETEFGELFFTYPYDDDNEWSPSTNIQDAWLVVEKLDTMNTVTKINNNSKIGYEVEMFKYDSENDLEDVFKLHEKTAPMAICLVALKSVGVEL